MIRCLKSLIILIAIVFVSSSFATEISISRINGAKGGERKTLTVSADSVASQISGFNLLVAYDQVLSYVYAVRPGELHNGYGWEYFNYRLITRDSLAVQMPGYKVHLINIIGLASLSGNPAPNVNLNNVVLARLDVKLALVLGSFSDETWTPFSFFWRDCNDNVLASIIGDTLYTANQLFENKSSFAPRDPVSFAFPGFGTPNVLCPPPNGEAVQQNIDFVNSGIWSFVTDPSVVCYTGEFNLNGIPYEIADLVLFIDYIIYGIVVLPWPPEASISQTDCNCDGYALSVGDVVCFIRTVVGDERFTKIPVMSGTNVDLKLSNNDYGRTFSINSESELALTYLRIFPKAENRLSVKDFNFAQSSARIGQIGDTITMMLVDLEWNPVLSASEHQLFEYVGNSEFEIEAWVVDMSGQETALKIESGLLPDSPELSQNYPNPFNPSTTIEFSLPSNADWKLEIYNVTGQLIKNFSGRATGATKVEWDGTGIDGVEVASGVYFYKLISKDVSTSHKMLLLK